MRGRYLTHLGAACAGLGRQINNAIKEYENSGDIKNIRSTLEDIYQRSEIKKYVRSFFSPHDFKTSF